MTAEDKARKVAELVASKLQSSEGTVGPVNAANGDWSDLQARLDTMYRDIRSGKAAPRIDTQTTGAIFEPKARAAVASAIDSSHISMEKFNVNEAIVDELVEFFEKEKACSFEPNGKPCDHCAMCSSRGF
jgi:hypothetical protein